MNRDTDILARTIYGEARGESISGQEAIASVILNRVAFAKRRGRYWWGNTIAGVCLAPWQFSCWNENDPNRKIIERADDADIGFAFANASLCVRRRDFGRPDFGRNALPYPQPAAKMVGRQNSLCRNRQSYLL